MKKYAALLLAAVIALLALVSCTENTPRSEGESGDEAAVKLNVALAPVEVVYNDPDPGIASDVPKTLFSDLFTIEIEDGRFYFTDPGDDERSKLGRLKSINMTVDTFERHLLIAYEDYRYRTDASDELMKSWRDGHVNAWSMQDAVHGHETLLIEKDDGTYLLFFASLDDDRGGDEWFYVTGARYAPATSAQDIRLVKTGETFNDREQFELNNPDFGDTRERFGMGRELYLRDGKLSYVVDGAATEIGRIDETDVSSFEAPVTYPAGKLWKVATGISFDEVYLIRDIYGNYYFCDAVVNSSGSLSFITVSKYKRVFSE